VYVSCSTLGGRLSTSCNSVTNLAVSSLGRCWCLRSISTRSWAVECESLVMLE